MGLVKEKKVIAETGITRRNLAILRRKGDIIYMASSNGTYLYDLDDIINAVENDPELKEKIWCKDSYRCADLFAGIGGIRLGIKQAFGEQVEFVYANEIDKRACETYKENFGESPYGDITKDDPADIPDLDIILGGFPCQPFSIAGHKNGFDDEDRGNLFFNIAKIIEEKQPLAYLLENVKHFKHHDKGKTFEIVKNTITDKLGYSFNAKVIDAREFGVPQKRKRTFMVGFKEDVTFEFPSGSNNHPSVGDILQSDVEDHYYISQQYLNTLKKHKKRHKEKGHGFGYQVLDKNDVANTLVVGGMGLERNMIEDKIPDDSYNNKGDDLSKPNKEGLRKLTPRECARIQGFPDDFKIPVPKTVAYKQFGNTVPVPVIKNIAEKIKKILKEN